MKNYDAPVAQVACPLNMDCKLDVNNSYGDFAKYLKRSTTMTNYKRMQHDKEFCAWLLANTTECRDLEKWMQWLDQEQVMLGAKLSRQENVPLTCDGCKQQGKWDNELEYGYNCPCCNCKRNSVDRYEPKGEPNV